MGAEDAFGFHAQGKFPSRTSSRLQRGTDGRLKVIVVVHTVEYSIHGLTCEGTGRRETETKRGISLLKGSFAHFIRTGMRVVNQSVVGSFLTYSSRKRP